MVVNGTRRRLRAVVAEDRRAPAISGPGPRRTTTPPFPRVPATSGPASDALKKAIADRAAKLRSACGLSPDAPCLMT